MKICNETELRFKDLEPGDVFDSEFNRVLIKLKSTLKYNDLLGYTTNAVSLETGATYSINENLKIERINACLKILD